MTQAMPTAEFDRYLGTVVTPECDLISRWREHADKKMRMHTHTLDM